MEEGSYCQLHGRKVYLNCVIIYEYFNWFLFPVSPNFLELRNFWEVPFLPDGFLDSDNQNKNKLPLKVLQTITLPIFF